MKNRIRGFGRSFAATVVMLCMLISMFAPTVLAADHDHSENITGVSEVDYSKVESLVDQTVDLVVEYYDEAVEAARQAADKVGTIENVRTAVDVFNDCLEQLIAALEEVDDKLPGVVENLPYPEETIANVKAEVNEIEDNLVALKNLIFDLDIENVETFANDANELLAAIEANIKDIHAQMIDLADVAVEKAYNAAAEAYDAVNDDVREAVDAIRSDTYKFVFEKLGTSYSELADEIVDRVSEIAPDVAEYLEKIFSYDYDKVIAFVKENAVLIKDSAKEAGAVGVITVIGSLAFTYGMDAFNFAVSLGYDVFHAISYLVNEYGPKAWDFVKYYCDSKGYTDMILGSDIANEIFGDVDTLKGYAKEIYNYLKNAIKETNEELDGLYADLELAVGEAKDDIIDRIDALKAEVAAKEDLLDQVEVILEELVALRGDLDDMLARLGDILNYFVEIEEAIVDLAIALADKSYDKVDAAVEKFNAAVEKVTGYYGDALKSAIAEIEKKVPEIRDTVELLYDKVVVLDDKAVEIVEIAGPKFKTLVEIFVAKAESFKNKVGEKVESIPAYIKNVIENAEKAYGIAADALMAMYKESISAEYNRNDDSYYVAIGDDVAAGKDSYVDRFVNDYLYNIKYDNFATVDSVTKDMLDAVVENAEAIAKADLVTIGYSNAAIFKYANADVDVDWSEIFDENVIELAKVALEKAETYVKAALVNAEYEDVEKYADIIEAAVSVVEKYVYAYVSHIVSLPEVINSVRETAPNALIVVVGAYNEFENAVIKTGDIKILADSGIAADVTIELGEYFDYLTKALNVEALLCAMSNENTIYVDAYSVATGFANSEDTVLSVLSGATDSVLPTDDGHRYIAYQIANAIGLIEDCTHVYDNACDDICNLCGYKRAVGPHVYTNNAPCDPDCNICGDKREAAAHTYGDWIIVRASTLNMMGERVHTCKDCGAKEYQLMPVIASPKDVDDGMSIGLILAIVIPSVLALGAGAFAIFWFGVKKKSWNDLKVAVVKLANNVATSVKKVFVKGN